MVTCIVGVGVWFVMDQQSRDDRAYNDRQINDLQEQINNLNKKVTGISLSHSN